jgi:hypothetical protein
MTHHCRECYAQVPPTARTGCCDLCRPVRRHSRPRRFTLRAQSDEDFRQLLDQHASQ